MSPAARAAQAEVSALLCAETESRQAPDARRVLRHERQTLMSTISTHVDSDIVQATAEARRVRLMWESV